MFKKKPVSKFKELHVVVSSHENCVSGSVRAAAELCKTLGKLKGCRLPTIYGGMKNHDMGVKAQFNSSKSLFRALACVEKVLLIEEARQSLNCNFSVFTKTPDGIKKLPTLRTLEGWHNLSPSQQIVVLSERFAPKHAGPSIEIQIQVNENGQVYFEGVGYVLVEDLGMTLKCKSTCVPGFVSFASEGLNLPEKYTNAVVFSARFREEGIERAISTLSIFSGQARNSKAILRYQVDDEFEYIHEISNLKEDLSPSFLGSNCRTPMVA